MLHVTSGGGITGRHYSIRVGAASPQSSSFTEWLTLLSSSLCETIPTPSFTISYKPQTNINSPRKLTLWHAYTRLPVMGHSRSCGDEWPSFVIPSLAERKSKILRLLLMLAEDCNQIVSSGLAAQRVNCYRDGWQWWGTTTTGALKLTCSMHLLTINLRVPVIWFLCSYNESRTGRGGGWTWTRVSSTVSPPIILNRDSDPIPVGYNVHTMSHPLSLTTGIESQILDTRHSPSWSGPPLHWSPLTNCLTAY